MPTTLKSDCDIERSDSNMNKKIMLKLTDILEQEKLISPDEKIKLHKLITKGGTT